MKTVKTANDGEIAFKAGIKIGTGVSVKTAGRERLRFGGKRTTHEAQAAVPVAPVMSEGTADIAAQRVESMATALPTTNDKHRSAVTHGSTVSHPDAAKSFNVEAKSGELCVQPMAICSPADPMPRSNDNFIDRRVFHNGINKHIDSPALPVVDANARAVLRLKVVKKVINYVDLPVEAAEFFVRLFAAGKYRHRLEKLVSRCHPDDRAKLEGIMDSARNTKCRRSQVCSIATNSATHAAGQYN